MATQMDRNELDLQEQLARIRQMGVNTDKAIAEMQKTRIDTKIVSFATVFQGFIAVAALLGAGAAIAKLFFP
ncbi:hypothetical protein [Sphingomonas hengshuiensis]|uniref:Uncharacterized protein n=1 Tax=Sphingomonas hengshuiensis TaxID=1609977 RepID=A0A7U4LFW5_9SPHN|nr:hypothetical protein [Sphingomonas hengshuiensis]AJP72875.1 hypothetical protein TS85_15410 [Sphingomonas hengshuiensis]